MTPYSSPVLSPLRGSVERTKHLQELIASVDSGGRTKLRLRFRLFLCLHSVSCIPDSPFIRQTDSIILRPSMQQVKCSNTLALNNKLKLWNCSLLVCIGLFLKTIKKIIIFPTYNIDDFISREMRKAHVLLIRQPLLSGCWHLDAHRVHKVQVLLLHVCSGKQMTKPKECTNHFLWT